METYDILNPKTTKALECAEWFAAKIFKEKLGTSLFDNSIYAIIKETEKAVYARMGSLFHAVYTWIPKSLITEEQGEKVTFVFDDFDACQEFVKSIKKMYA